MRGLAGHFQEYRLVLEIRHASWADARLLGTLSELGIGLCNIDQPLLGRALKPSVHATSPVGHVRLHGRNYKTWFSENAQTHERYDYLYSVDELEPWVNRINIISSQAEDTYLIANNHYLGKAAVNAIEIASILKGEPVEAPPSLLQNYSELQEFATSPRTRSS